MIRRALSALCWEHAGDPEQARGWASLGIEGIEGVPGKMLPSWPVLHEYEAMKARTILDEENLEVPAIQAFLYEKPECSLFSNPQAFALGVMEAARLAQYWRSPYLVWGAPASRRRNGIGYSQAIAHARDILHPLCERLQAMHGVTLLIEHNPARYGCDFITTPGEAVELVGAVSSSGFGMHMDIGALDDVAQGVEFLKWSAHVHASQPGLAPFSCSTRHGVMASAISRMVENRWVSLEMLPPPGGMEQARQAVSSFVSCYGGEHG